MLNPRSIAAEALYQVVYQGKSLTEVLQRPTLANLPEADKVLVKDMCFGSLRWHFALNQILDRLLVKPMKKKDRDVECLIRIGLYQLQYQHTADHAAVNETVNACKKLKKPWSKGLVNGVLRSFIREKDTLTKSIKPHTVFPLWLIKRIKQNWRACWKEVLVASSQRAPMTLRVNTSLNNRESYIAKLVSAGIMAKPHALVATAIELEKPVNVQQLPGFNKGYVSVQDASAQLAAPLLDTKPGMRVLDACAAPGGKTGHILESTSNVFLTALDTDAQRLSRVNENVQRLGFDTSDNNHITLIAADANELQHWYDGKPFERILLDAPCSALGVMRRHPDIKVLRQESDIAALVRQQQRLLESMWQILSVEGLLLYATCSILPEENDLQIEQFIKAHTGEVEAIPIHSKLGIKWGVRCTYGHQILPHTDNMDGFYYCLLKKLAVSC